MPDYTTLCRCQKTLPVMLGGRPSSGGLHLLVDSTGIKMMGEGEWKTRKQGASYRRQWRKVHIGIDAETLDIRAIEVTTNSVGDAPVLPDLLAQIPLGEPVTMGGELASQFPAGILLGEKGRNARRREQSLPAASSRASARSPPRIPPSTSPATLVHCFPARTGHYGAARTAGVPELFAPARAACERGRYLTVDSRLVRRKHPVAHKLAIHAVVIMPVKKRLVAIQESEAGAESEAMSIQWGEGALGAATMLLFTWALGCAG
ncbi:MAG: hypothetical protein RIS94_1048 [Pseudomonadota bacterium]|jgi:hypothetical protein